MVDRERILTYQKVEKRRASRLPAKMLRKMKGLHNILVHEYGRVDDHRVYAMFSQGVQDFLRFQQQILSALKKLEEERWGGCLR